MPSRVVAVKCTRPFSRSTSLDEPLECNDRQSRPPPAYYNCRALSPTRLDSTHNHIPVPSGSSRTTSAFEPTRTCKAGSHSRAGPSNSKRTALCERGSQIWPRLLFLCARRRPIRRMTYRPIPEARKKTLQRTKCGALQRQARRTWKVKGKCAMQPVTSRISHWQPCRDPLTSPMLVTLCEQAFRLRR